MKYISSYRHVAEFGRKLLERPALDDGFDLISTYIKEVVPVDRCSIFIYNRKLNLLWTTLADGAKKIIVSGDEGIVGYCVQNAEPIIVNDAYSDDRFNANIDKISVYKTKNLAVVPILSSSGRVLGALELLNKNDDFDEDDLKFMKFFSGYISGYIELAMLFEKDNSLLYQDRYLHR